MQYLHFLENCLSQPILYCHLEGQITLAVTVQLTNVSSQGSNPQVAGVNPS
jgi:hypothetical protein